MTKSGNFCSHSSCCFAGVQRSALPGCVGAANVRWSASPYPRGHLCGPGPDSGCSLDRYAARPSNCAFRNVARDLRCLRRYMVRLGGQLLKIHSGRTALKVTGLGRGQLSIRCPHPAACRRTHGRQFATDPPGPSVLAARERAPGGHPDRPRWKALLSAAVAHSPPMRSRPLFELRVAAAPWREQSATPAQNLALR